MNARHFHANSQQNAGARSHQEADPPLFGKSIHVEQIINFLLVIKERLLWGLTAGILPSALFAFVMLRMEPVYQSEALLLIESKGAKVIDVDQVVDTNIDSYWGDDSPDLENHLRQMQSRSFLNNVVKTFNEEERALITTAYSSQDPNKGPVSIHPLLENLVVVDRDGQVFSIVVEHHNPEAAALIANRYAAQYITDIITRSGVGTQSALEFLQAQAEELRNKISSSEQKLTEYRSRHNLVSLEDNQNIIVERLKAINAERTSARMLQLQLESVVEQVNSAQEASLDLTEIPAIAEYGSIADILSRKKEIEAERAELTLRYLEMHPRMIEEEKRLGQVTQQLDIETKRAVRDLQNQKDTIDRRIDHLVAELQAAEAEALTLDQRAVEYNVLKRQLDSDRQTFDSIVNRLNETNLTAKLDVTNLRILDEAIAASHPISPNFLKIGIASIGLFIIGLVSMSFVIEAIDNRLKSAYDVESFIGKPLLADIPHLNELDLTNSSGIGLNPEAEDILTEGFRSAYSGLQMYSKVDMPKTILVTSTRPSEGKSFISSNLASTMAKHGLRCLLVDADFRRPSLHRHFDLKNDKGIIPWYEHVCINDRMPKMPDVARDEHLAIQKIAAGFDFLRAGGSTKKTTELIDSVAFERLLDGLREVYDVVILDTPPVSVFTDSLFLSEFADEVIYVAQFNTVSRQKVRHFIHKLDGLHHKVIGMIINNRTSSKGQRYGYEHHYSYYSSDYKYYKRYIQDEADRKVPDNKSRSRRSVATTDI